MISVLSLAYRAVCDDQWPSRSLQALQAQPQSRGGFVVHSCRGSPGRIPSLIFQIEDMPVSGESLVGLLPAVQWAAASYRGLSV